MFQYFLYKLLSSRSRDLDDKTYELFEPLIAQYITRFCYKWYLNSESRHHELDTTSNNRSMRPCHYDASNGKFSDRSGHSVTSAGHDRETKRLNNRKAYNNDERFVMNSATGHTTPGTFKRSETHPSVMSRLFEACRGTRQHNQILPLLPDECPFTLIFKNVGNVKNSTMNQ